jgi:predicted XRE-type DNA-binding protein
MKIRSIKANNHKKVFEVRTYKGAYEYPYAKLDLRPTNANPLADFYVDDELGDEAFTYTLASGDEDTIHIDRVLEHNRDPAYMRDLLLYQLTIEAKKRVNESGMSVRNISRMLGTSATQYYRLLDEDNYRKSMDQMVNLLAVLGCTVDVNVREPK